MLRRALLASFLALLMVESSAHAKSVSAEWKALPPQVLSCLRLVAQRDNVTLEAIIANGVRPSDARLAPFVQTCTQIAKPLRQRFDCTLKDPNGNTIQTLCREHYVNDQMQEITVDEALQISLGGRNVQMMNTEIPEGLAARQTAASNTQHADPPNSSSGGQSAASNTQRAEPPNSSSGGQSEANDNSLSSTTPSDSDWAAKCNQRGVLGPEEKIAACTKAIEASGGTKDDGDKAALYYERAYAFYALGLQNKTGQFDGTYNKAIADFDFAIRLNPQFSRAYNGRGSISFDKHDYANALSDFQKAVEISPDYSDAVHNVEVAKDKLMLQSCRFEAISMKHFTGNFLCTDEIVMNNGMKISQGRDRGIGSVKAVLDYGADTQSYILDQMQGNGIVCVSIAWERDGADLEIEANYEDRGGGKIVKLKSGNFWGWINNRQICE